MLWLPFLNNWVLSLDPEIDPDVFSFYVVRDKGQLWVLTCRRLNTIRTVQSGLVELGKTSAVTDQMASSYTPIILASWRREWGSILLKLAAAEVAGFIIFGNMQDDTAVTYTPLSTFNAAAMN